MSHIEISHNHQDGTLATGTEKGDGAGPVMRSYGFRWGRSIQAYYIRDSRDRAARRVAINAAAETLRTAGHTVTVTIDDTPRDNATVRADRHERLEERRTALSAKGTRLHAESEALHRASDAMVEHLPLGQPVAPGRRGQAHRNLLERSVNTAVKAAAVASEAQRMPGRVAASRAAEARAERPDVVARRVKRAEAEMRRLDRRMEALRQYTSANSEMLRAQYEGERAVLAERIAGDRALLDQATAEGRFGQYSRANVHKDDQVMIRGQWRQVARANARTVSVTTGYSWTDKYGWEEVRGLRCHHADETPTA